MNIIYSYSSNSNKIQPSNMYGKMLYISISKTRMYSFDSNIIFYCDKDSEQFFIDLGIKDLCDEFKVIDYEFDNFDPSFIPYHKFYVMSLQNEPFIYVDYYMMFNDYFDANNIILSTDGNEVVCNGTLVNIFGKYTKYKVNDEEPPIFIDTKMIGGYNVNKIFKDNFEFIKENLTKDKLKLWNNNDLISLENYRLSQLVQVNNFTIETIPDFNIQIKNMIEDKLNINELYEEIKYIQK